MEGKWQALDSGVLFPLPNSRGVRQGSVALLILQRYLFGHGVFTNPSKHFRSLQLPKADISVSLRKWDTRGLSGVEGSRKLFE